MANRRMFSKQIVESDDFLSLTPQAQLLYFHLGLNCDDRGYINNTRAIMGMTGTTEEHKEELVKKKFLLKRRTNGLYLIKHFPLNNYIQKDRFKETAYLDDLQELYFDEHGCYTERKTEKPCIQIVYKMDTQYSIEENKENSITSIEKDTRENKPTYTENEQKALDNAQSIKEAIAITQSLYEMKYLVEKEDNFKEYKTIIAKYVKELGSEEVVSRITKLIQRISNIATGEIEVYGIDKKEMLTKMLKQ